MDGGAWGPAVGPGDAPVGGAAWKVVGRGLVAITAGACVAPGTTSMTVGLEAMGLGLGVSTLQVGGVAAAVLMESSCDLLAGASAAAVKEDTEGVFAGGAGPGPAGQDPSSPLSRA